MSTSDPVTLTLDSATLYATALTSLTSQPQPLSHPLPPPPSSLPYQKLISKTRFVVDGFKHASDFSVSYFLSHFHSDHYTGLNPNWSKGIIFCSATTARLLIDILKVPVPFVIPLPLNERVVIDGSEVILIDANHCPGAVQFLFKVPITNGKFEKYVHTGDFRYCEGMKSLPELNEFIGADAVFLDTTYCNPKYVFPGQEESIDYVVSVIERIMAKYEEGMVKKVLFLVATYVVGKERILVEIARRCKRKVCVDSRKMAILSVLGLGGSGLLTEDESETNVHVVGWNVLGETWPYFRPNFVKMKEIMGERGYSRVVGFVPTGWTYEVKRNKFSVRTKDSFEIHLVPYSEHSNYGELREYVKFLKPKRIIPTVGVDVEKQDSKHANAIRKHFAGLLDEMAIKQEFLMGFGRVTCEVDEKDENGETSATNILLEQETEGLSSNPNCSNDVEGQEAVKSTCPKMGPDSQGLSENDVKESIQELCDCLPSWVTQDQMLDLLRNSGGNVVEAVSNFYEHETEFHEQVAACTSFDCILPESLTSKADYHEVTQNQSVLHSKPGPVNWAPRTEAVSLNQSYRLSSMDNSKKSSVSPGKRKRSIQNKRSKKSGTNSLLEKQHTITRFFTKVLPLGSEENKDGTEIDKDRQCQNVLEHDGNEQYKSEVDQFIQIVNGDESLRSYAASIMGKAKGDVNVALHIYYDRGGTIAENKGNLLESRKSVHSQCNKINKTSDQDVEAAEKQKKESDLPLPELATDRLTGSNVSLPLESYSPTEHACWKNGQAAPYLHLARTFDLVEDEKGKIKATSMLCNMFRSLLLLSPEDVLPAVYLCTNKIAPDNENMELNIGGSIVVAALEEVCGTNKSKIRELYNSLGDLGDVAQLCRQTQSLLAPPPPLTIRGVYAVLRKISEQSGSGSTTRKKNLIVNLLCSCREKEMKYLVRTLVRNMRIGAMMRTVLPALAHAIVMNSSSSEGIENIKEHLQSLSATVIEAYNILPSLDLLIPLFLEKGIRFSSMTLSMVPGVPIKPMLAKITNGASQLLKLFEKKAFTCEYKYDGQRAQIHRLEDGTVRVFSRNGDETTSRFPDLVNTIKELCDPAAGTFILDAEVVAIDRNNGEKLMSFQELSSRERGNKDSLIAMDKIKVDICIFVFDIMLANGKQLLGQPLRERRKYLKVLLGEAKVGFLEYAREMTVESDEACPDNEATLTKINSFLEDALRSSCEGIMVKSLDLDGRYAPSKRSDAWLKVKRDYVEGLSDSLDLVPIGAWYGNGRKAGWYSPFLMACYDPDTEEFQSVCRVMSGFSDSFYIEMKDFYSGDKILAKKPPYYRTAEAPDMWFSPELVWEIRGADFTISPVHHAAFGIVHPSRGVSVRFPRFIRCVTDRKPEECSTAADIADMFQSQTRKMNVIVKR